MQRAEARQICAQRRADQPVVAAERIDKVIE
jgi:hypothetical protein